MTVAPTNSRRWWTDPSLIGLLIANGLTIWFVLGEQPSLLNVLWIYWGQSVVIGLLTIARIFAYGTAPTTMTQSLKGFSPKVAPAVTNRIAKWLYAPFFLLHYGAFHLTYAIFLAAFSADISNVSGFGGQAVSLAVIVPAVCAFALAHGFSFIRHRQEEINLPTTVDSLVGRAYLRIMPMHLTIVFGGLLTIYFGGGSSLVLLLFLSLKAISDIGAHIAEHQSEA